MTLTRRLWTKVENKAWDLARDGIINILMNLAGFIEVLEEQAEHLGTHPSRGDTVPGSVSEDILYTATLYWMGLRSLKLQRFHLVTDLQPGEVFMMETPSHGKVTQTLGVILTSSQKMTKNHIMVREVTWLDLITKNTKTTSNFIGKPTQGGGGGQFGVTIPIPTDVVIRVTIPGYDIRMKKGLLRRW